MLWTGFGLGLVAFISYTLMFIGGSLMTSHKWPPPGDSYVMHLETVLQKAFGREMNGPWTDWAQKTLTGIEIRCLEQAGVKLKPGVRRPDE
jgi:hypothetical protein